jgi:hypothetical protein
VKNVEVGIREPYESRIATNKVLPARRGGFFASRLFLLFARKGAKPAWRQTGRKGI